MDNNKLIAIAAVLLGIICIVIFINDDRTSSEPPISTSEAPINDASTPENKTDTEVILDYAANAIQNQVEKNQTKDSVWEAGREKKWVYQIGEPTTEKETLLEPYKKLNNVRNIRIFKDGKKYFIYKDDGYSYAALNDSLNSFQSKFDIIGVRLKIVDLMEKCSRKRKEVVSGDIIRIKGNKETIKLPCYICD